MAIQTMRPLVLDLSHHNEIEDWNKVYASGVRAVIHKATQGSSFVDQDYAKRKAAAKASGLLWGAYHFADSSDVEKQVANFLKVVGEDEDTLLALDYEPNGARTMSLAQAKKFLQLVYEKTEQRPILYSGNLIKETLKKADPFFSSHRLWLAQYGKKAILPPGFDRYWLWQYSGDGINGAGIIPGIKTKGIDCNVFGGEDLGSEWGHWPNRAAPTQVPGRENATIADLKGSSRTVDTMLLVKKTGTALAAGSTIAGAVSETVSPPKIQIPDALLSVDNLQVASESAGHAKALVESGKGIVSDLMPLLTTIWDGALMLLKSIATLVLTFGQMATLNGWIVGVLIGIVMFFIADKMLGWRLEEYVFGRWHPNEEPA